jgi:hypothetical protein
MAGVNAGFCYYCRLPLVVKGKRGDARFCSDKHRLAYWRRLQRAPGGWAAGREYRGCERCGVQLWRPGHLWPRANRRYCSTRCRVAAHRARLAAG